MAPKGPPRWLAAHGPTLAGLGLLVVLYAGACARYASQHFMSPQLLFNLVDDRAVLGIVAVGLTFVIISGGIDLSVGAVMGLCSVVVAKLITGAGWPAWAALGVALAGGVAFGVFQGAIIQRTGLAPFIVTLAGMFLARGVGFLISLDPVSISAPGHARLAALAWRVGGEPPVGTLRVGAIVLLVLVLVTAYGGRFTRTGRSVYALGGSEEAALLMGLPVPRTRVLVYAFSGLCSALAGIVFSLQLSSSGQMDGVGMELDAIAAVVIGGALLSGGSGGVLGSFVGTLIIGLILTIVTYEGGLGAGMIRVLIGGLLLAFVLLQKLLSRLAGAENPHGEPL